jgi:F0F1-type ATP synthase membrane subunit a
MTTNVKDWIVFVLSVGLMILLMIIVIGDFYVALQEHRPVDESIVNLLQMAVTGIVGIVAGYLSGKDKS